jgi:dynein heavy chain
VKRVLELFALTENTMEIMIHDITKLYEEASEITRFLTTVERQLKNLMYGVSFQVVMDTIPPLVNALRMIWVVSKYFNTDEKV